MKSAGAGVGYLHAQTCIKYDLFNFYYFVGLFRVRRERVRVTETARKGLLFVRFMNTKMQLTSCWPLTISIRET
jgi:hypothetical protein